MNQTAEPIWYSQRTAESRQVEEVVRAAGFAQADAYRYDSASIRVRVIDARFAGLSHDRRVDLFEPSLEMLPAETQADIITSFLFAPSELHQAQWTREDILNYEFEEPSPATR